MVLASGLTLLCVVLCALLALAWFKGGPQPMRWIEQPVDTLPPGQRAGPGQVPSGVVKGTVGQVTIGGRSVQGKTA